ncbi:ABC transporter permease [Glaciibacter psychrotolerans]|uniref:Autoinducer 2 import system permease protein LsrD n=1 Tax=Glaciibacter psychrotolerans TaxID=670054 RepID=A0A7Z0EGX4_9MICO|nr:ABC transporter permease [Leifsonia psychrotolerans]NYJ21298.1 ribose transport system permease protein [Leifsonia psychrotolerans]
MSLDLATKPAPSAQTGSAAAPVGLLRRVTDVIFQRSAELVGISLLLLVLLSLYALYDQSLFTGKSIIMLSAQFLPLIIASMAQAIVMLTGGIDLSIGAVLSLVMSIFAVLAGTGVGVVGAILIALSVGMLVGLLNGALVAFARLPPIIVTLAASFLWSGVTLVILPQPGGLIPADLIRAYNKGWNGLALGVVALIIVLALWKYIARSRFGLSIYAVGGNEHGAFASGIRVRSVTLWAYGLSGLFTGIAGIALTIQTGTGDANLGVPYTLNTIAASILGGVSFLGGIGRMRGVVMGALVVAILPILLLFIGVSPFYQLVVQGGVLIIAFASKYVLTRGKQAV